MFTRLLCEVLEEIAQLVQSPSAGAQSSLSLAGKGVSISLLCGTQLPAGFDWSPEQRVSGAGIKILFYQHFKVVIDDNSTAFKKFFAQCVDFKDTSLSAYLYEATIPAPSSGPRCQRAPQTFVPAWRW